MDKQCDEPRRFAIGTDAEEKQYQAHARVQEPLDYKGCCEAGYDGEHGVVFGDAGLNIWGWEVVVRCVVGKKYRNTLQLYKNMTLK